MQYLGREPWSCGYGRRLFLGGRGFKSLHCILNGLEILPQLFVVKIVLFVWKDENELKRGRVGRFWHKHENTPYIFDYWANPVVLLNPKLHWLRQIVTTLREFHWWFWIIFLDAIAKAKKLICESIAQNLKRVSLTKSFLALAMAFNLLLSNPT